MRVMLVNDFYSPFMVGGTEAHMRDLAFELRRRGHVVCAVTARIGNLLDAETIGGILVFRIGRFPKKEISYRIASGSAPGALSWHTRAGFTEALKSFRPDIVHFFNPWLLGPDILSIPALRKGITINDYWPLCPRRILLRVNWKICPGPSMLACRLCRLRAFATWKNLDLLHIEAERKSHSRLLATCNFVISPTQYVADRIWKNLAVQSSILTYGIRLDQSFLSSDVSQKFVLYAGRVSKEKGYPVLLQAFDLPELSAYTLYVAGNPPTNNRSNIRILGWQSPEQLAQWMQKAQCVVVPSIWPEPAGIVILEAMRAGVPVVGSRVGGIPELIVDGCTGLLVTPGNPTELAAAIRRCCEDETLRTSAQENGPRIVRERFSLESMVSRLETLYAS